LLKSIESTESRVVELVLQVRDREFAPNFPEAGFWRALFPGCPQSVGEPIASAGITSYKTTRQDLFPTTPFLASEERIFVTRVVGGILWASGGNRMRLKLGYPPLAGLMILLMIAAIPVDAALRPSFDLDDCSWKATHVVLVKTTSKDGVFSVVKSWKGDLKPADSLEVLGLKPDKDAVPISSYPQPRQFQYDSSGVSERIPRQPVGSQMILFLKRRQEGGPTSSSASIGRVQWESVYGPAGIQVSVLWVDEGKAFCFRPFDNPWPSALSECSWWPARSSDVAVLIARIEQVLRVQRDLAETLVFPNEDLRARRLGRIALGDVYHARSEAMEALGKSGSLALPEVLQIMDQSPSFDDENQLIQVFVGAAGEDSGRQLHARLQQDLIYWKAIAPTLTPDWLGQLTEPGAPLFVKFSETKLLVQELDREHYAPATPTVTELRDFWVSQPRLYDRQWGERDLSRGGTGLEEIQAGLFGLVKDCDDFVKHAGIDKTGR
jgi:hypothetical protein